MRPLTAALQLILLSLSILAARPDPNGIAALFPNGYIVELERGTHLETRSPHEDFYDHLRKRDAPFTIRTEFNCKDLFTGASIVLQNPSDIAEIASAPGVIAVRPIVQFPAPQFGLPTVVNSSTTPQAAPLVLPSNLRLTHVDKLHSEGVLGKGVKVGIIDGGVDYTHPLLGGAFGPSHKVNIGHDFVGDNFTGSNTPVPDDDPLDNCKNEGSGHGTHVAGIIAADPGNGISGVAPQSTIGAYRVFGCDPLGSAPDDIIVKALCRADTDGMDVINLSLGHGYGWTSSTSSDLASRLAAKGTTVVLSAGNDGKRGSWYSGSPGNAVDAIGVASVDTPELSTGGLVSSFSSYGPTYDMFFKPTVAAPGGRIVSTWPVAHGSFAALSGTSMASPAAAGSAALVISARGKGNVNPFEIRDLFQTTAQPVPASNANPTFFQTLSQQGAGLLDVYSAVHTTTIVSPGQLMLNDTAYFEPLTNKGTTTKTFKLSHVAAGTMQSVKPGSVHASLGPVPLTSEAASVIISPSTITLSPGQSLPVEATFTPPKNVDKSTFPVYSGWIVLTSSDEALRVAYMGVASALKDKAVFDNSKDLFGFSLPAIRVKPNGKTGVSSVISTPKNYTFAGNDFPWMLFRFAFGTPKLVIDVVDAATSFTPTIPLPSPPNGARKRNVPARFVPRAVADGSFAAVEILGSFGESENPLTRNSEDLGEGKGGFFEIPMSEARFGNGTEIPNGNYRLLLRALRVTGDESKEEDYDSWLSPIIGVQQKP